MLQEKVVEYQEIDNNPNENIDIRNDAVAKAYGSEKRGRVRARGFGVTPTAENLHNRSTQKVRELESQLHTQSQRVEILEQKFEQMTAFMLKQVNHLLFLFFLKLKKNKIKYICINNIR